MRIGVVDAVALRRFDEPTLVRYVAARLRCESLTQKDVRSVVRSFAGTGALARLTKAIVAEIKRQEKVRDDRIERRESYEDPGYYDPVHALMESDHLAAEEGDYYSEGEAGRAKLHQLDRKTAIFKHLVGGGDDGWKRFRAAFGEEYAGWVEVIDARFVNGKLVALVRPDWRNRPNGKCQRWRVSRFLVVPPATRRHKPVAVRIKADCHTVGDAIQSLMPKDVVVVLNYHLDALEPDEPPTFRVELDWRRRRFIVTDRGIRTQHPFRKIGITPEGATKLKWCVLSVGGNEWLRRALI
jgi:hypothetical protein